MSQNILTPMWLPANIPAPSAVCSRLGCSTSFVYCDVCGGKMYRIKHNSAPLLMSATMEEAVGLSHNGIRVEYRHECRKNA
jgi:hypothetical protein